MLKIWSSQKKILRILIATFLVMISSFIFTNSISALEAHNINDLDLFSEEITEDYLYETFGVDKEAFPYVVMYSSEGSLGYRTYLFFMTENDNLGLRDYESGGVFFCTFYGDFAYYTWTSTDAITEEIELANYTINYKSGASKGTWRGSLSSEHFYYFSNFDILTLNNPESNALTDTKITTDVYLPANKIQNYDFNENIDVTNISKIKINFELPEDTSNLDVDISWTFDNLIEGGKGIFTTPYLELIHFNGDVTLTQSLDSLDAGQWFSGNYNITFLPDSDITTINLIVDVMDATGLMNVIFSSKFSYVISYEYVSDVEDYFITIDMDDYASISLIPKVYNIETGVSSSISSPIYKYGIYDIEIWEDLDTKAVIDRWDNHISSYFVYPIYSDHKNCVIHFIKKEVDASNRYVKFDSRYYIYVLKKYLNEEVIITNPNTNEEVIISDTSDLYKYNSSFDDRFSFNSFLKPIKFVFESITDFYNNYCPVIVQHFFYIIFAFFIMLILIRVFL